MDCERSATQYTAYSPVDYILAPSSYIMYQGTIGASGLRDADRTAYPRSRATAAW